MELDDIIKIEEIDTDLIITDSNATDSHHFELNVLEVRRVKLEQNNTISLLQGEGEIVCNMIMTEQLSRTLVIPPKQSCVFITKSNDFLAYVIIGHGSNLQIVKITHMDSREYVIIQQTEGSIASIALNHLDLLAVLDDNYILKIYSNQFIDQKVVFTELFTEIPVMFSKIHLGMAWNNPSQEQLSLAIWNKEMVIVKDFNHRSRDLIDSMKDLIPIRSLYLDFSDDVVIARLTSNALYIVVVLADNDVLIFHRPNHSTEFGRYLIKQTGVIGHLALSLQVYEHQISAQPTSLILVWPDRVYIYDIKESKSHSFITFNPPCNFIMCANSNEQILPLVDVTNKILIVIKLDCCDENLIAKHLICYPFKFKTLSFVAEISCTDPNTLLLYDYHTSGMQLHRISLDVKAQPLTIDEDIESEEQTSLMSDAIASFFKSAQFEPPLCTIKTVIEESTDEIKIVQVDTLNESIDILTDQGNSDSDSNAFQKLTDNSIIEEEAGNIDSTHYLTREILDNIIYLQKFINQSLTTFNRKLMTHFSYQFNELRKTQDMKSQKSIVTHLGHIENRLKCLEENHILLLRKLDDFRTFDEGKSTLSNIEKSLLTFNKKININGVHDACTLLTPQFKQSLSALLNDTAKQQLEEILVDKISTFIQAEFKSLFGTINTVFYTGTQKYLSSVGKYIDGLINDKIHELNPPSGNKDELINLLANVQESLIRSFHQSLEHTCQKLEKNISISVNQALKLPVHNSNDEMAINMSESFIKLFDELLFRKKYREALEYCCETRNSHLLTRLLNIAPPRDLFNLKNEIPVTTIKQFIRWISDEDISLTNEAIFKHLFESLFVFASNRGPVDPSFFNVLKKLEQKLNTLVTMAGTEPPMIVLVLHMIGSISLVI